MKLLVLAQIPPPLHGQSVMVQTAVDGLPAHGVALHHVNLGLSRHAADIGQWRVAKVFALLGACGRTILARFTHGCDTLYYVPAPGKRGALYRDWVVMFLCRPFFKRLILHWHATGLTAWLTTHATAVERGLTRLLLGRAALSIVLNDQLRSDAEFLSARKIAVVANGISDPLAGHEVWSAATNPHRTTAMGETSLPASHQILFLGLGSREKGLFATAEAILAANRASEKASTTLPRFKLVAAGPFPDAATGAAFRALCTQHPEEISHAGTVIGAEKHRLFIRSFGFCLPTRYAAEGQPLVLLEAMAYDLPIIATRWRGIPATLPPGASLVEPGDASALLQALQQLSVAPPARGISRQHFLAYYTTAHHLSALTAAVNGVA